MKAWEVSLLVYDYLKRNNYVNTQQTFNNECKYLQLSEPPPDIFECVRNSLVSCGNLEDRLSGKTKDLSKIKVLKKEIHTIRKGLKRVKRRLSDGEQKPKTKKQKNNTVDYGDYQNNNTYLGTYVQETDLSKSVNNAHSISSVNQPPVIRQTPVLVTSDIQTSRRHDTADHYQAAVVGTPEKRHSKRKPATPKKLPECVEDKVKTLAKNINSRDNEAALETLETVTPWLEQFITSISEPVIQEEHQSFLDPQPQPKEEAALSLLALNNSEDGATTNISRENSLMYRNPSISDVQPLIGPSDSPKTYTELQPLSSTPNLLELASKVITDSPTKGTMHEDDLTQKPHYAPIKILNKKLLDPPKTNVEVVIVPPNSTISYHAPRYTTILPKPLSYSESPVPISYYKNSNLNLIANTEAHKFFNRKPYHQQHGVTNQVQFSDQAITATKTVNLPSSLAAVPVVQNSTVAPVRKKEDFNTWDAAIRQILAKTEKEKTPVKKRKRRCKIKDPATKTDNLIKTKDEVKDDKVKRKSKKNQRRKKKGIQKKKNVDDKKVITPKYVETSADSDVDLNSSTKLNASFGSDSVMAEMLNRNMEEDKPDQVSANVGRPQECSPSVASPPNEIGESLAVTKTLEPFIEENANPSFDIDESTRPKPVFISEKSQNSCSCSSNHFSERAQKQEKKSFSFKDDDYVNSPQYYNESSSVTVSSLFPINADSKIVKSLNVSDQMYRSKDTTTDSDVSDANEPESEEEREKVVPLPPLSSENKDLLESSDDDQNNSVGSSKENIQSNNFNQERPETPARSLILSESDNDSTKAFTTQNLNPETELPVSESPTTRSRSKVESETEESHDLAIAAEDAEPSEETKNPENSGDIQNTENPGDINNPENIERNENNGNPEDSCDKWYKNIKNKIPNVCSHCKDTFPSKAVLEIHRNICPDRKVLVCDLCNKVCTSKSGLTNHRNRCAVATPTKKQTRGQKKPKRPSIKINKKTPEKGKKSIRKKKKISRTPSFEQDIDEFLGGLRYK